MFPYIKLTLDEDSVMWIRYDTIAQVYLDGDDTTISTTTEEHDFSVLETVDEVIEMLRVFYPEENYHHSIGSGVNNVDTVFFNTETTLL